MKRTISGILAVLCAAGTYAGIVKNGGFEKMDGWSVALHKQDFASIVQVTDDVQEGKTALKFEFTQKPKVYIAISRQFPLKPGFKAIKGSLKYKAPAGGGNLLFMFPKSKTKVIGLPPSQEWKTFDFRVDIPEKAPSGRIEIRFSKQGTMLIDDVEAELVIETN